MEQVGALGYFGDARRAAVGTELIERVTAMGSLVIRKLGATHAGELAIHRFLSAPSVTCKGNPGRAHARGDRGVADCRRARHHRDQLLSPRGQSSRAWTCRRWGFGGFFHSSLGRHR